jgi:endoglucanase
MATSHAEAKDAMKRTQVAASSAAASGAGKAATSVDEQNPEAHELLWNNGFESTALRPWVAVFESPKNGHAAVQKGALCLDVAQAGSQPMDVVVRQGPLAVEKGHHYRFRLKTDASTATKMRVSLRHNGSPATDVWTRDLELAPSANGHEPQSHDVAFEAAAQDPDVDLTLELGGPLAGAPAFRVCLDDASLQDPQFEAPRERLHAVPIPVVRVNQVGYAPGLPKGATVASTSQEPLAWELVDAAGATKARGQTRVFGPDASAGEAVHQIDFSGFKGQGRGFKLKVGSAESAPFDIGPDIYKKLAADALSFFYLQRSGIPIEMPYAGSPAYVRPAGHPGDKSVPCSREAACNYSLDVSGGWYDAGDHGKYLVNSGVSVWLLQNEYEAATLFSKPGLDKFGDGALNIPEHKNGRPDLLDEARWNVEFMLKMQVPEGQPHAGMAHHKIHGEKWSPIPTAPDRDPIPRFLRPVSTAATLNLAGAAAQAARLWKTLDPAFSARCLAAAERAFAAAKQNPFISAEKTVEGGGAYGDGNMSDETYWAATELFLTTGKPEYGREVTSSRLHTPKQLPGTLSQIGWNEMGMPAKLDLAMVPSPLGEAGMAEQRKQILQIADRLLGFIARQGHALPVSPSGTFVWGSNSNVLGAGIILGAAYLFSHDAKYLAGAVASLDYILGRNALAQSYVAGYGARALHNPHHRVWAHLKDPSLPEAPAGAVSGGPNAMLQDPYIRKLGKSGCPSQTCYVDHTDSYSTNEVAINWNAALAWLAAFLDAAARGA